MAIGRKTAPSAFSAALLALWTLFLIAGCTAPYFRKAPSPADEPSQRLTLAKWPFQEYWAGIVFNGAKIGFSRFALSRDPDRSDLFQIRSEAVFRIRFLAFDKRVHLQAVDRVREDLSMVDFVYDYDLDGHRKRLIGRREGGRLRVRLEAGGASRDLAIPAEDALFPTSVIAMFPVREGLAIGRSYRYAVFDGETESVSEVFQEVVAYEESDLFPGRAFKVRTRLHGQEVVSWIDESGRPVLEMSMGGVLIAALETASAAKAYLAQAALNKEEALLDFSRVPVDRSIDEPRRIMRLSAAVEGIPAAFSFPSDPRQRCERRTGSQRIVCRIRAEAGAAGGALPPVSGLTATLAVPVHHPRITALAQEIAGEATSGSERVRRLLDWIDSHIEPAPVDVFSALDVLEGRKGECQGQTYLFAALSRTLGIPTRVVNGIVYASSDQGFLYHTWAECLLDGSWTAVDPTFGQIPADATHIKLIEGEAPSDLFPLVALMGKISVKMIETR